MGGIGFKLDFDSDYRTVGKWVNDVELGFQSVNFLKMEPTTEKALSSKLKVHSEGSASVFPKGRIHEK